MTPPISIALPILLLVVTPAASHLHADDKTTSRPAISKPSSTPPDRIYRQPDLPRWKPHDLVIDAPAGTSQSAAKMNDIQTRLRREVVAIGRIPASQPEPAASQPTSFADLPRRPKDLTRILRTMVRQMRRSQPAGPTTRPTDN